MNNLRKGFVYWISLTVIVGSLNVGAVELISDDRVVQQFSDEGSKTFTPDAPFANFTAPGHNTQVSQSEFSGSGNGYGESDFFFFIRESTFDVTFEVEVETEMILDGLFGGFPGDFGFSEVTVDLYDGADTSSANVLFSDSIQPDFNIFEDEFSFSALLAPRTYRLVIDTNITPGGFGTEGYFNFSAQFSSDSDGDGVDDLVDNCTFVDNFEQLDEDGDNYGNACDADFNNDCIVNFVDINAFANEFLGTNPLFDLNGDGAVNFIDYSIVTAQFLQAPGPGNGVCD